MKETESFMAEDCIGSPAKTVICTGAFIDFELKWNLILYTLAVVPVSILVGYLANRPDQFLLRKLTDKKSNRK